MKTGEIVDRANLTFPDDVVFMEPKIISERLQRKANIPKRDLSRALSNLYESAIKSTGFPYLIPPGLEAGTVDMFKILVAARWANSIQTINPSLGTIAKLSKLNRNLVGSFIRFLEIFDLVSTKSHIRSQLVFPTVLTTLCIDVISGNLRNEHDHLKRVADEVKQDKLSSESLKFLDNLETAFHMTKLAYHETTVNYEIMEDLHNRIRELVVIAKEGRNEDFVKNAEQFLEMLRHISTVREKAKSLGVRPVILEDTGEKLGRAKVFRAK